MTLHSAPAREKERADRDLFSLSFWMIAGTLLLALVAWSAALVNIPPHDLWWQLKSGQIISEEGHLPTQDRFSYTARGEPWLVQEWLSNLIFYMLVRSFGLESLVALKFALVALAITALYAAGRARGANGLTAMACVAFSLLAMRAWFPIRPQLFSYVLIAVLFALLNVSEQRGKTKALWFIPPLTALWANMHGAALLAPILLTLAALGSALDALYHRYSSKRLTEERESWRQAIRLGWTTLGAVAATLATPHGIALWGYPARVLGHPRVAGFITEWQSADFHLSGLRWAALLMGVVILGFILRGARPPFRDLLIVGFLLASGLMYRRNIALFALSAAPVLAGVAADLFRRWEWESARKWPWVGGLAAVISLYPISRAIERIPRELPFRVQAWMVEFPEGAIGYLERHPPKGNLWNQYRWGGYLIWRLPQVPVFIDGRAELYYRRKIFDDYIRLHELNAGWRDALDRYEITTVLIQPGMPLVEALWATGEWRIAYRDKAAMVLERRGTIPRQPSEQPTGMLPVTVEEMFQSSF